MCINGRKRAGIGLSVKGWKSCRKASLAKGDQRKIPFCTPKSREALCVTKQVWYPTSPNNSHVEKICSVATKQPMKQRRYVNKGIAYVMINATYYPAQSCVGIILIRSLNRVAAGRLNLPNLVILLCCMAACKGLPQSWHWNFSDFPRPPDYVNFFELWKSMQLRVVYDHASENRSVWYQVNGNCLLI